MQQSSFPANAREVILVRVMARWLRTQDFKLQGQRLRYLEALRMTEVAKLRTLATITLRLTDSENLKESKDESNVKICL